MNVTAYIALGSNLGDRRQYMDRALAELRSHPRIAVGKVSTCWETSPEGGPAGQGGYLNAAAELATDLPPAELLAELLAVEQRLGRLRRERFGPRTIDLDLLTYGDAVVREAGLIVPHPRMHRRRFVLGPLVEIAPTLVHPVTRRTMVELLAGLAAAQSLVGRRAVVTGASSGIGRAIALAFAEQGADVLVHSRASRELLEETAALVEARGVECRRLLADFSDPAACESFVEVAWSEFGPIDLWVNNAGVDILTGGRIHLAYEEKLQALLDVDVRATMFFGKTIGERMKARGAGVMLNMGWDQADTGMAGASGELFAAAKSAVMAFSRSLALSLAPQVRVNCLAPGWIKTAWGAQASASWQERVLRETPLGRWGTPEDVAQAAIWLCSPAGDFITGQTIRINGGAVR